MVNLVNGDHFDTLSKKSNYFLSQETDLIGNKIRDLSRGSNLATLTPQRWSIVNTDLNNRCWIGDSIVRRKQAEAEEVDPDEEVHFKFEL